MRLVVALWAGAWSCWVVPYPVVAADVPCAKTSNPIEMTACLAATVEYKLGRVLRIEQAIMRGLQRVTPADDAKPPTGVSAPRVRFEAAKTAWARVREAACDAQASVYAEGTIEGVIRLVCQSNLATARLRELKQAYRDVLRVHR